MKMFDKSTKGIYGLLVCRTKFIDEKLIEALKNGAQQVVILGAGMDTRPYRIEGINTVKVFEVDMSSVQNVKMKMVQKHFGLLPPNITYVPIDFNSQSIEDVLKASKFDFTKTTFTICEGVTQYITKDAVDNIFNLVSKMAAGSSIAFTYVLESVINRTSTIEGAKEIMDYSKKKNWQWQFGIEPGNMVDFLKKYNLQLAQDVGADYYQGKYLQPIGRQLFVSEVERVVLAKK